MDIVLHNNIEMTDYEVLAKLSELFNKEYKDVYLDFVYYPQQDMASVTIERGDEDE